MEKAMEKGKLPIYILETGNRRAKLSEIWDSEELIHDIH